MLSTSPQCRSFPQLSPVWTSACPCLRKDAVHLPPALYPAKGISACADKRGIHRWRLTLHLISNWFWLIHDLIVTLEWEKILLRRQLIDSYCCFLTHLWQPYFSLFLYLPTHMHSRESCHCTIPAFGMETPPQQPGTRVGCGDVGCSPRPSPQGQCSPCTRPLHQHRGQNFPAVLTLMC